MHIKFHLFCEIETVSETDAESNEESIGCGVSRSFKA